MLGKEMLVKQFGYNAWANERVLDQAALVDDTLLNDASVVDGRSLGQVLAHMARVERVWRLLAESGSLDPDQLPSEESLSSVDAVRNLLADEQESMRSYLDGLDVDDLVEELVIRRWDGVEIAMTRWYMLTHLLLHSMQHRSEAAVVLTSYGHSPGDIDFLFYIV